MGQLRDEQRQRAISALNGFLSTPLSNLVQPSEDRGVNSVLQLFQDVVTKVPAYQQFLATHHRSIDDIQTWEDFQTLPLITKENYLCQYSLSQLCRHGQLETCDLIAVSSGEQIFYDSFQADQRRTLAVICFTLGTWVGGIYTTACCRHLATKGYPLTVITPGNQKPEIFRVIRELGEQFEQVVLLGYPPFIKDVIDTGITEGIEWAKYQVKLVFAGEVFSEEWRRLVGERVGSTQPNYDSASLYGTADAGVLGNETPLSICIRQFLSENPEIAKQLFGESRLPTLVQYDPKSRFFEVQKTDNSITGTLLFSGDNGIPLIRYHIADQGGIIEFQEMLNFLKQWDFDPILELQKTGDRGIYPLPFVFIFGRSQFIISYFGANIYPENITVGLEQPLIKDWVTGKFVMSILEDSDQNRFLSVVVELAPGIEETEDKKQAIAHSILTQLKRLNSEFANYVPPEYQTPQITLKLTADPEYFPLGVKHRYTRN